MEDIILKHSKRGMTILKEYLEADFCAKAAQELLEAEKGNVFIATGFYVAGYAETDGPLGAFFLGRALKKLGYRPIIVTDSFCEGFFEDELEVLYLPIRHDGDPAVYEDLIREFEPVCLISIERCGRTQDNEYRNMRGISIKQYTSPIDMLFDIARAKNIYTLGIGDGGNEIGMGNLKEVIDEKLELIPCIVEVDRLIIATVSNWGAYGLIASLQLYTGEALLPSFEEVRAYLSKIVGIGSVDGVTKEKVLSVDGFDPSYEEEILDHLSRALERHSFNHFTMSEEYSGLSLSQFHIGQTVICRMKEFVAGETDGLVGTARTAAGEISVLDIGCGPGNLTSELLKDLEPVRADITAIDIDPKAISQAKKNYGGIRFEVGDLYAPNPNTIKYDYVFSNETLHWMPKLPEAFYGSDHIIYYFFEQDLRKQYGEWALSCYRRSFRNIRDYMKKESAAFLQFGLDGQLKEVYRLVDRVLREYCPSGTGLYKLPLYYPTAPELEELCRETGFDILEMRNIREELSEDSPEEIVGFLKGFMENNLRRILGKEKTAKLFEIIYNELEGMNIQKFSENQWNHTIVVLKRQQ
jgi:SAM-dependent methyltransferase